MESYICKRCGYETAHKQNLLSHLRRKNPCKAVLEDISIDILISNEKSKNDEEKRFGCQYCSKKFTCCSNKSRHESICRLKNKPDNVVVNIQQNIQQIQQNNLTIDRRSFGYENIDHLEKDKSFMTNCFLNKDVMGLIENIHFDTDHPENHNVRIKSTKKEFMETYVDGRWIVSDQEETLDELLLKGYRILNFFSYRNKNKIVEECDDVEEYHAMRDWLEELYNDNKLRKPLKRKLLILFMNNKTLFLEKTEDALLEV